MRFILMGMATKESETGPPPKPEAFAAMQEYNEDLAKRGILLGLLDHQGRVAGRSDRVGETHAEHLSEREGRGRDPQADGRRGLR